MTQLDIEIDYHDDVELTVNCDRGIASELWDYFSFFPKDYKWMKSFKSGHWDGKIRLFNTRSHKLFFGLHTHLQKFAEDREYAFGRTERLEAHFRSISIPKFDIPRAVEFVRTLKLPFVPYNYQMDTLINAIQQGRSLNISPTNSGKSLAMYMMHRLYNKRTLVIVPRVGLVSQLQRHFTEYSQDVPWDAEENMHLITAGVEKETDKKIVVSTWQSMVKQPAAYLNQFDLFMGDEAHHFDAKSLNTIMKKMTNVPIKHGFTGTLDGSAVHKLVLEGMFGKAHYPITTKEMMDKGYSTQMEIKAIQLEYPVEDCKKIKVKEVTAIGKKKTRNRKYPEENDLICQHEKRNKFVHNLACSREGNTLVLFRFIEHGKELFSQILDKVEDGRKVFFIDGSVPGKSRDKIAQIVATEKNAIIVASYGTFSEGVDIPNIHHTIFGFPPGKSRVLILQSIGRGLRKGIDKYLITVYDIGDNFTVGKYANFHFRHFTDRLELYLKEQFKVNVTKVSM
jgi:superfamily II DNA or RNA helicase